MSSPCAPRAIQTHSMTLTRSLGPASDQPRASSFRAAAMRAAVVLIASSLGCQPDPPPQPQGRVLPPPPSKPSPPRSSIKFDVGAPAPQPAANAATVSTLRERLAATGSDAPALRSMSRVEAFYAARAHEPAWIDGLRPNALAVAVLRAAAKLGEHGIDPETLDIPSLDPNAPGPGDPVGFELQITDLWLTVGDRLLSKRPGAPAKAADRNRALLEALGKAIDDGNPGTALLQLATPPAPK
ncbi:MAG: hypothetical protein K0V04_22700 [Deltaproteobacteria bacterium]|nr:hypothetical protein [Deltaproteobacteria bacterium]